MNNKKKTYEVEKVTLSMLASRLSAFESSDPDSESDSEPAPPFESESVFTIERSTNCGLDDGVELSFRFDSPDEEGEEGEDGGRKSERNSANIRLRENGETMPTYLQGWKWLVPDRRP